MIFTWVCVVFCLSIGILFVISINLSSSSTLIRVLGTIGSVVICLAICFVLLWSLYFTENGKRAQKTFESNIHGGLYRIVKVYDVKGDQLCEYKGKFDVEETYTEGITKIKFDLNGERHIIYCSTGTVIIDEISKN